MSKHRENDHHFGPGVRVERRAVLTCAALAGLTSLAAAGPRRGARSSADPAFEDFASAWREITDLYLEGDELDLTYMYLLAAEIARLPLAAVPARRRKVFANERIETGPAFIDGSIFIVVLDMKPGAEIRPHNHPDHVVATTCLNGSCTYRHFEPLEPLPSTSDLETGFRIRQTRRGVLLPGRTTHLTRERDNMHTFRAGKEGARLLDFTIERAKGGAFGMLAIGDEGGFDGVRDARWTEVTF